MTNGIINLYDNIDQGLKGLNIGISTGSPKLDSVLFGIQKRYVYTVGADTSGGKTSFALDVFVYNVLKHAGSNKVAILYYSFEMAEEILLAKLLSRYIYDEFGVMVTSSEILSLEAPLSEYLLTYVYRAKAWLNEVSKLLTIYDKPLKPENIYGTCKQWLRGYGDFVPQGEHKEDYVEHDAAQYKIVLIDHVGLIPGSGSKKERIDLVADYFIYFRKKCGITGVLIQQMNRNSKGMDRKLNGYELYQLDDFKDTSGTTDASEVVIALYYPYREKVAKCEGYDIKNQLKKRFRLCQVLKNRYGNADINIGLNFFGEIGMFNELPKPELINDYEPYLNLKQI